MSARSAFKQADLTRAVRGVEAAGLKVSRILLNDNGIEVFVGEPETLGRNKPNMADRLYGSKA